MLDNKTESNERQNRLTDLKDKIVLVTGAGGAIGSAVVTAVRHVGGTAIATDLAAGTGADTPLDVTSEADWQRVIADVEAKHGRLDGLVNAAGIAMVGSIEKTDYATWKRVLSVNLDGTFLGCKYAFPLLRKKGGAIVNLSSVLALVGSSNLTAYNASKGGVSLLTKSVALNGARYRPSVRCNAVCPAFIEGAMVDGIAETRRIRSRAAAADRRHSDRQARPAGRSRQALRLSVSDDASFITGADFPIDGGLTAR